MKRGAVIIAAALWLVAGCRTPHDVAESSYQTATTPPAAAVRQPPPPGTTATTTTANPGTPPAVSSSTQTVTPITPTSQSEGTTSTYTEGRPSTSQAKPPPASSQLDFP